MSGVFAIRGESITLKLLVTLAVSMNIATLRRITNQTFCAGAFTEPKFEMRNVYIKFAENMKCRRSRKLEHTGVRSGWPGAEGSTRAYQTAATCYY